jgi:hypothetical protein
MKFRTPLLDYNTAVDIACLCSMNLQKALEQRSLRHKLAAYYVAVGQYKVVRRYALDVAGWCHNTKMPRDRESLQCVWEMRQTLNSLRVHLGTLEHEYKLVGCSAPMKSITRLRTACN